MGTATPKRSYLRVLGGGREVGRSCLLLHHAGRSILLDCGLHPGKRFKARLPQFDGLRGLQPDAVIITHYHVDHIGALPYLYRKIGYRGPVYMTAPTQTLGRLVLHDFVNRHGEELNLSDRDVDLCLGSVHELPLGASTEVATGVDVTFLYAGHALGAVSVQLVVDGHVVLYSGDIASSPERLLGALDWSFCAKPHTLILESTYGGRIREDSRRANERLLLDEVTRTLQNQGRVLIPAFSVGRTQEILAILRSFWRRTGLQYPIFLSSPLAHRATNLFAEEDVIWFSKGTQQAMLTRNESSSDKELFLTDRRLIERRDLPFVLIAAPAMLNAGGFKQTLISSTGRAKRNVETETCSIIILDPNQFSLRFVLVPYSFSLSGFSREVYGKWRHDPRNLVALPGYGHIDGETVAPTGGGSMSSSKAAKGECVVRNYSLSAHTDASGLFQLVRRALPNQVVLVHGEEKGMQNLAGLLKSDLAVRAHMPRNNEELDLFRFSPGEAGSNTLLTAEDMRGKDSPGKAEESSGSPLALARDALDMFLAGWGSTDLSDRQTCRCYLPCVDPTSTVSALRAVIDEDMPSVQRMFGINQKALRNARNALLDWERGIFSPVSIGPASVRLITADRTDQQNRSNDNQLLLQSKKKDGHEFCRFWTNAVSSHLNPSRKARET